MLHDVLDLCHPLDFVTKLECVMGTLKTRIHQGKVDITFPSIMSFWPSKISVIDVEFAVVN